MRHTVLMLSLMLVLVPVLGSAAPAPTAAASQQLLRENLMLGDSLQGQPANATIATRLEQTVTQGLAAARALVAADPKSAEAQDLLGLFLSVAYRPLPATARGVVLRRGSATPVELQQGLEALRTAATLRPDSVGFRLDYAWGLLLAGQLATARAELSAVANQFPKISAPERARLQRLQSQAGESAAAAPETGPAPSTITWLSLDDALAAARRDNKRVLVDFMAEWCGWCKKMDKDTFSKPEVIALSKNYVFARVDADKQGAVAQRYKVSGYPTVIAMNAEGKEAKRAVGYKSAQEFVRTFQ